MYNPSLGRFNTIDPYRQDYSPYQAMGNNPISNIDPDGGRYRATAATERKRLALKRLYKEMWFDGRMDYIKNTFSYNSYSLTLDLMWREYSYDGYSPYTDPCWTMLQDYETRLYWQSRPDWKGGRSERKTGGAEIAWMQASLDNMAVEQWSASIVANHQNKEAALKGGKVVYDEKGNAIGYNTTEEVTDYDTPIRDKGQWGNGPLIEFGPIKGYAKKDVIKFNPFEDSRNVGRIDVGRFQNQAGFSGAEDLIGPLLIALGQPIKSLKPVGALGSRPGSSIASKTLSKAFPQTFTKTLGQRVGTKVATRVGTNVIGRFAGRLVPGVGWGLLLYDVGSYMHAGTQKVVNEQYGGDFDAYRQDIVPYGIKCFVAGTKITMSDGSLKKIEDVETGDIVKTYNLKLKKIEENLVLEIESPNHSDLVEIGFEGNIENTNTFDHPYYVKGKGWSSYKPDETLIKYGLKAFQLEVGDICYLYKKDSLIEIKVISLKENVRLEKTYNLSSVANNNNFFANGILVHNKFSPSETNIQKIIKEKEQIDE